MSLTTFASPTVAQVHPHVLFAIDDIVVHITCWNHFEHVALCCWELRQFQLLLCWSKFTLTSDINKRSREFLRHVSMQYLHWDNTMTKIRLKHRQQLRHTKGKTFLYIYILAVLARMKSLLTKLRLKDNGRRSRDTWNTWRRHPDRRVR